MSENKLSRVNYKTTIDSMNIVIVGHVDHGKSTIIGRLLVDTKSLTKGKLKQVKESCRRNSKPFEYAFLLDALKDEQAQGITIDAARVFFSTAKREYIIIDAPGHIEFLKNMVTGASRAESALLVIDAHEGIKENSKRHGYLLSMLGIKQISVLVNKMDLVDYSQEVFNNIEKEYRKFLKDIDVEPKSFIPLSGIKGDNIASFSKNTSWYKGKTVLETLDSFKSEKKKDKQAFRMPVQDVYKFTKDDDNRRIVAGTVETGILNIGDDLVFYPSGKKSKVKTIESFNTEKLESISAGYATGFTLEEQIYIKRGEIAVKVNEEKPKLSTRFSAKIFWLGKNPLVKNKDYFLKLGTAKERVKLENLTRVLDASSLDSLEKNFIERHDVAECIFKTNNPIAFDEGTFIEGTSRFVIIDDYDIAGGGLITEAKQDSQTNIRENVLLRNSNWEIGYVSEEERSEIYNHDSKLILITGQLGAGRRDIAKTLERKLLKTGKKAYYLGIENLDYGLDSDIKKTDIKAKKKEEIRRFGEISHIILDAGNILIASVIELEEEDIKTLKIILSPDKIEILWVGERVTTDIKHNLHLDKFDNVDEAVDIINLYLQENGIIYKK